MARTPGCPVSRWSTACSCSSGASFFFRADAMLKLFQIRVAVVLLAGFTLAAAVLASLNLAKEGSFPLPTDQVSWVEAPGGLMAQRVLKDGPGQRAGIKAGDLLTAAKLSGSRGAN